MFIGDWLDRRGRLSPDAVALVDATRGGRPITYREWDRDANRTARLLEALGVGRGERVAILAPNSVAYLDVWFACGKLGAVLQTLNARLTPAELAPLIAEARPVALVYALEFSEQVRAVRALLPGRLLGVALGPVAETDDDLAFSRREALSPDPVPGPELDWDDPWLLCYTGGTTGSPKAAVLTHGNVVWNAVNTVLSWGLTASDVAILNAPMFHTGGLNVLTAPLVQVGGRSIVCRGFDVDQVFDLVRDGGATHLFGVPTMFLAIQSHPRWESADFSRLKLVISGGAPCPPSVFERFWERGVDFKTGYGLTEAGPNTFWLPAADVRRKPGSVGVPLYYVDVQIVRLDGVACGPDEVGELLIRGPHVCEGYYNRPDETAATFRNGWLHTGDLARRDAEGYHWIVGRIKDVIISGGENIYPAEVEGVLASHPAVAEAALIGVPDPTWGESPRALVVPRSGTSLDPAELVAFAGLRLARYKLPKSVLVVDALPKTAAGKVDKDRLQKAHGGS